jgi:hypothetical protein
MAEVRARYGALIATAGAALLAVSVFLPWYSLSLTAAGISSAQQAVNNAAAQYGNAALQNQVRGIGASFGGLAGHQLTTLSAHQTLKYISVALLILAAIAFLSGLLRLVSVTDSPLSGSGQIALVGVMASVCVLFRIVERPAPEQDAFSLSLSGGIWLALGSSAAIVLGGVWSGRVSRQSDLSSSTLTKAWDGLSGWTPGQ